MGCGTIEVKGAENIPGLNKKKSNERAQKSTPGDTKQKNEEPAKTKTEKTSLSADFSPNPKRFGTYRAKGSVSLSDLGIKNRSCDHGYVAHKPSLVVELPKSYKRMKVTSTGGDLIYIKRPDGKFHCVKTHRIGKVPSVLAKDFPKGKYKIFVGTRGPRDVAKFDVVFEDMKRAKSLDWLDAKVPSVALNGRVDGLQFFSRGFTASENESRRERYGNSRCGRSMSLRYTKKPDLRIEVKKRTTFVLGLRSHFQGYATLLGPLPEDNRNIPQQCVSSSKQMTLEPGTYFVRMGYEKGTNAGFVNYFMHGPDREELPETAMFDDIPRGLQIKQRQVTNHFPFLDGEKIQENDALRKELFMKAPKQLFVATKLGLDKHTAEADVVHFSYGSRDEFRTEEPSFEYPKKNEPLLMLNYSGKVLAADGSIYDVQVKDLVPIEKASSIQLPRKVRNPQLYFDHALKMAAESDQELLQRRKRRYKRFNNCADKYWDRVNPRLKRLNDYPRVNKHKIARIRRETEAKAKRNCGWSNIKKKDETVVWKTLIENRTERRQEALEEITERLNKILAK